MTKCVRMRNAVAHMELVGDIGIDQSFAIFNLSLRGAWRRGNLDEVEHTTANRRCCDDEIATLRSQ